MRRLSCRIIFAMTLVGCKDENWGDNIEKFVDGEVYELSKRQAKAEIRSKWDEYFRTLGGYTSIRLDGIGNELEQASVIASMPVQTIEDRSRIISAIETTNLILISTQGQIEILDREIRNVESICEDDTALVNLRMDKIGDNIARSIIVPNPEWYVGFNCTFGGSSSNDKEAANKGNDNTGDSGQCWQGLVDTVTSLFGYSKQRVQKSKALDAIRRIPEKVISSEEVLALSREICKEERSSRKTHEILNVVSNINAQYRDAHKSVALAMFELKHSVEKVQAPHLKRQIQLQTGTSATIESLVQAKTNSDMKSVIELNRKELAYWEAAASNIQQSCPEAIASVQVFRRLIAEKAIQVSAVRMAEKWVSIDLIEFEHSLESGARSADLRLSTLHNGGCQ